MISEFNMPCSVLGIFKRNHLPLISILGCISCVYILSQTNTSSKDEHLAIESRDYSKGLYRGPHTSDNDVKRGEVPIVLNQDYNENIDRNAPKEDIANVKIEEPPKADIAVETAPSNNQVPQQPPAQPEAGDDSGLEVTYQDPSRVQFPGYEQCARVVFQPEHAMPLVALAVYMSSGDVVIRQRLQAATGIYTGSYFWDKGEAEYPRAKSGIFLGSTIDYTLGRTVVAKTQIAQPEHIVTFEGGVVLVIRNPYTMLISEYIRRKKETDPTRQWTTDEIVEWFKLSDWKTFFQTEVGNWRSFAIQWITYAKRLLIVSYEYFFDQPVQETTRIIVFLNVQQDDERISCSIQSYPNDPTNNEIYFDPYTGEMKQLITTYIQEVNQTIITRGLRPLPTWKRTC